MSDSPSFDLNVAHRYFSTDCFNKTWDYMDKATRTPAEDLAMLHTSLASLWHWTQRKDHSDENLSVSYWQVSRVYALLGQAENAHTYGELALQAAHGENVPPYCLGYAHESLARAALLAGDRTTMQSHLSEARAALEHIKDDETRKVLLADLATIG